MDSFVTQSRRQALGLGRGILPESMIDGRQKRTSWLKIHIARRLISLTMVAFTLLSAEGNAIAGTWTKLTNPAPVAIQLMLLLSDGTVMAANSTVSNGWYRLTPDIHGSYVNGIWTPLQPMANSRLYYCSYVLQDGRVFVAGGEYPKPPSATAEIYNPITNTWTTISPPAGLLNPASGQNFSDAGGVILPDGRILIAPVTSGASKTLIYSPATNSWSAGPNYLSGTQNEASWVKLPDNSILTADPTGTASERYIPASGAAGSWINDGVLSASLYDTIGSEIGPAFLLSDGRAFFSGANGKTALYTPTGNNNPGTWAAGPQILNVRQYPVDNQGNETQGSAFFTPGAAPDAAGAMMVNGRILCAYSGQLYNDPRGGTVVPGDTAGYWVNHTNPQYPAPTTFFEYDPVGNTFVPINGPQYAATADITDDVAAYQTGMLALPDGTILYAHENTDLYVYNPLVNPSSSPLAVGKPTISTISTNVDGSYHLIGTKLNGISQGAGYGDDAQMDSNYPIARFTAPNGDIIYGRTFNWSSTGVMTGNAAVSTEFTVPNNVFGPGYSLVVSANGNASNPISFAGPIWVDFTYTGATQNGSFDFPYKTLASGIAAVPAGGTLHFKGPRTSNATLSTLSTPMTWVATGGPVTIGQ